MRLLTIATLLCAFAAAPAFAAEEASACAKEPHTEGMRARMTVIRDQMDRIETTADRAEQRRLMEVHAKHLREGAREMRQHKLGPECRMEMMASMLEAVVRHDLFMHDAH